MRPRLRHPILCGVALGAALAARLDGQAPKPLDPRCQSLLPAEAANRLTGRTDLVLLGRKALPAAGGTCNYASKGKKMVFLVTILDEKSHAKEQYERHKREAEYATHQREVPGLGDAAFTGGTYEHELVARKGNQLLMIGSMFSYDRTTHQMSAAVSRDTLVAIAREVLGKL